MTGITWLHLSDWHQGSKEGGIDRERVLNELIEDIAKRKDNISSKLERIDFIVFSGDLAYSAKSSQYEEARFFLDKVLEATELSRDHLFIVPGNHDLDQKIKDKYLPKELKKSPEDAQTYQNIIKWLKDENDREYLLKPFTEYRKFVTEYSGQESSDYGSIKIININGLKVGLLGLNSALMSARYYDQQGDVKDKEQLIVGECQIFDNLTKKINDDRINDCDVRIAVLHHPLDWLTRTTDEQQHIESLLVQNFNFVLCGHEHRSKCQIKDGTENSDKFAYISIGAGFENREYSNNYSFVHLNFAEKKGKIYFRAWYRDRQKWDVGTSIRQNGEYELDGILPNLIKRWNERMNKEISLSLQDHYKNLAKILIPGSFVTFLGADINLCDRPKEKKDEKKDISNPWNWKPTGTYPPTYLEIAAYIDKELSKGNSDGTKSKYLDVMKCPFCNDKKFPDQCPLHNQYKDVNRLALQHVSEYFWLTNQEKQKFRNCINNICNPNQDNFKTNRIHRFLASLPSLIKKPSFKSSGADLHRQHNYPLIVTTCFDRLLEKAFENAKEPFDLVFFTDPNKEEMTGQPWKYQEYNYKDNSKSLKFPDIKSISESKDDGWLDKRPVILRLCNRVDYLSQDAGESFNITEDNFLSFLIENFIEELPDGISNALITRPFWFLGYSPSYWNLRGVIQKVGALKVSKDGEDPKEVEQQEIKKQMDWLAVQEKPEILDKQFWSAQKGKGQFIPEDDEKNFSLEAYIDGLEWYLQTQ